MHVPTCTRTGVGDELTESSMRKKDMQIAWLHAEASKTTHFLGTILPGMK